MFKSYVVERRDIYVLDKVLVNKVVLLNKVVLVCKVVVAVVPEYTQERDDDDDDHALDNVDTEDDALDNLSLRKHNSIVN